MPERVGEVSAYREADTKEAGGKRRRWPDAVKRELVAATLEPGGGHSVGSQINNAKEKAICRQSVRRMIPQSFILWTSALASLCSLFPVHRTRPAIVIRPEMPAIFGGRRPFFGYPALALFI